MKKALAAIGCLFVLWAILSILPTVAQVPQFPQNLPANSVVGRTGITAGPAQAIPFSQLLPLVTGAVGNGTITNSMLANMPADTLKCNNTSSAASPIDCTIAQAKTLLSIITVSVRDFGAVCDGATDDTGSIQSAINSLPNNGGIVLFPAGQNCKITATLNVGNGTTTTVSTRQGIILQGLGQPATYGAPFFNGYPVATGPKLTWGGASNGNMILVNGPLQGWGVQNLILDCASSPSTNGIQVVSGSFGDNRNLSILNCGGNGIVSTSNPLGGYTGVGKADSFRNNWTNITILVPAIAAAKGVNLTGEPGGTSNTDYNLWTNVFIRTPGGVANFGWYLQLNDSNTYVDVAGSGFSGGGVAMTLDYSLNANFPSSNSFYGFEFTNFQNIGSPTAAASNNKFYGLVEANSAPAPNLNGTLYEGRAPVVALTGQTGAISATNIGFQVVGPGELYRFNVYMVITTAGSAGTFTPNVSWNDGTGVKTLAGTAVNTTGGYTQFTAPLFVGSASTPQYSVTASGVTGSPQYSLYIATERIQP